jgi:hypothetical protein
MRLSRQLDEDFNDCLSSVPVGQPVAVRSLRRMISPIAQKYNINLVIGTQFKDIPRHKKYPFLVQGFYYAEIPKNRSDILVRLDFWPGTSHFVATRSLLSRFTFALSSVIQHELIHKDQFKRKSLARFEKVYYPIQKNKTISEKKLNAQMYLGEYCEIHAHAHDIALEMRRCYPQHSCEHIITNIHQFPKLYTYREYKKVFQGTDWSNIHTLLTNAVMRWYPTAHPTNFRH